MRQLLYRVSLAVAAPLLVACAASAPPVSAQTTAAADTARRSTTTTAAASLPAEDVSKYRPAAATTPPKPAPAPASVALAPKPAFVAPANQVNDRLEQRLRDQAFMNQNVRYTQGYRILAYVGLEREQAMRIRREVISRYPEETDYITFKQPVYRLYIGDYTTKLEAARGMMRVRPLAPKAELESASVVLNKTP